MATLAEFRQQHPEYQNRSDMELARALHSKYYSQIEFGTFARKIGMLDEAPTSGAADYQAMQERRQASGGGPALTQPVEYRTALEGAGKFFTDMALGGRQLVDLVGPYYGRKSQSAPLQAEAAAKRELDQPLMETGAGQTGYVGAGVLSALPAGAIPGVNSIVGSGLVGAGLGALQPTAAPGERLTNTVVGGTVGAVIPAALKYAPQLGTFGAALKKSLARPTETAEQVAARSATGGSAGASAAAVDLSGITPDMRQAVATAGRRGGGVYPEVLARHAEADSLPVPIRLTAGEAAADPALISRERNLRGKHNEMGARMEESNKALGQNLQAIRNQVGDQVFSTNVVEHGDTLIAAYEAKDALAKRAVDVQYHRLRQAAGGNMPVDARAVLNNASAALHKELLFDHAPPEIMRTLTRLADSNSMTFENFESMRTNLARIARSSADGNVKAAAGVIRSELEQIPLRAGAEHLKPIADAARALARRRFQAMEADPAYKAAVNGTVPPDNFVRKFVIGAARDQLGILAKALENDPAARQTMSVAALDYLREAARLDPGYGGNFSTAGYSRALDQLNPKANLIFDAQTVETLGKLRNVAGYTTAQPRGSYVNNSNTLVGALATPVGQSVEGAINYATLGVGAPFGKWARGKIDGGADRRFITNALKPGAGLRRPRNALTEPPNGG